MDNRVVGAGTRTAGVGIRMIDILQEVVDAGIPLVAASIQHVVAAGILRHTAVAVEAPYTVVEGSRPFCCTLIYSSILYKAHQM